MWDLGSFVAVKKWQVLVLVRGMGWWKEESRDPEAPFQPPLNCFHFGKAPDLFALSFPGLSNLQVLD